MRADVPGHGTNDESGLIMKSLLVAASLVFASALAPAAYAHEAGKHSSTVQSSPDAAKAPYDIQFLDTMAEHHREGIGMFEMAVDKAQDRGVRDKAQQMIDAQQKEIPELKSLRDDIESEAPQAVNMALPGMKPMDVSKLESSTGKDFDRRFIDMTIEHHEGAVTMSRDALEHAKISEVKDRARTMVDKQNKEIAELKQMRSTLP